MIQGYEDCQQICRPEGRYSNYFKVGHNALEFVLDFGQAFPEEGEGMQTYTRIITHPVYAKVLLEILRDSVDQFERSFGAIPKPE